MIILIQFIFLLIMILKIRHLSDEILHLSDEKVLNRALNEPLTWCSPEVDFRALLAKVNRLVTDDAVDLDTICEHLLPGEGNSKTDRYALDGDLEDPSEGESKSRPNESKTNGKNDFSRFRRKMGNLAGNSVVKRWQPNEDLLHDIVCEKLFNGSVTRLDDFIREASEVRNRCLKLLRFRKSQEEEMVVQCVFIRFLATILGPMQQWTVLPVNTFQLSASVPVDGSPPSVRASTRTLNGFADVGIFERDVNEPSKQFLVVGEIKASLLELNTYRQKDQLLIEMEGVRQGWASDTEAHHPFVRGFLTDMITINIAIADNRHDKPVFYVARRGWSHRSFLIRLLFLLCGDLPDETWEALSVETPLSVGCKAGPTTRSQTQGRQQGKLTTAVEGAISDNVEVLRGPDALRRLAGARQSKRKRKRL